MDLETKPLERERDALVQGLAGNGLQLECADALLEDPGRAEDARNAVRRALSLTRANLREVRETTPGWWTTPPTHVGSHDLSVWEDPDEQPCE